MTALLAGTLVAGVLASSLAALAWRRREHPGGRFFAAMMAVNALWLFGFAVELTATDASSALPWFRWRSAVIAFVPALWALFTLEYADYGEWVSLRAVTVVTAPAALTAALSFTNPVHELFWSEPSLVVEGPFRLLVVQFATGWWVSVAVSYLLVTAGMILIAGIAVQSTGLYRKQSLLVLGAAVVPALTNAAYHVGASPVPHLDMTPFGFVINGFVVFWALYDYRLFDLSPVARSAVVDRMDDPMVAVDGNGHVVDVNPTARDLSAVPDPLGRKFSESFPEVSDSVDIVASTMTDEVVYDGDGDRQYFEPRVTPLGDQQGAVIVLRDVTLRRERERSLEAIQAASRDLMRAETPDAVAERTVRAVRDVLDLEHAAVHLEENDELRPIAHTDAVVDLYDPVPAFDVGEGLQGTVFETSEPLVYRDVRGKDVLRDESTPFRGVAVFPLGDRGTLSAAATTPFEHDETLVRLTSLLSANAAAALTRAERESELRERERELARQNEQLDEFASVVSHDLRNPLTVADGYLEKAREEGDVGALDRVESAIDRMDRLTDELLELARNGRVVTDPSPVSLSDLAAEAWKNVDTGDACLDVRTDAVIRADRPRLLQLFENLFRNSIEHGSTNNWTQSGDSGEHGSSGDPNASCSADAVGCASADFDSKPPRDAAETGVSPPAGRSPSGGDNSDDEAATDSPLSVTVGTFEHGFYVSDTGRGISPENREKVLEQGFTTSDDGTGFGLAIVHEIAEAHGWSVRVDESAEQGARFEIVGVE